jgi:malate dehydrogenase (oxaloacetate-decarboxylating)
LRETSFVVAVAVARAAVEDGVARAALAGDVGEQVRAHMWQPVYHPVRPA